MSTSSADRAAIAFLTVFGMSWSFRSRKMRWPRRRIFPDDGGTLGVKQLHAHLDEGLLLCEAVQKSQRFFPAVEVQCNDNVFTHDVLLL